MEYKPNMKGLKPCPFCGSDAEMDSSIMGLGYRVACTNYNCEIWGPSRSRRTTAKVAWNKRVFSRQLPQK